MAGLFGQVDYRACGPAADTEILPQAKPRTIGVDFIMPAIGGRDIGGSEWPGIGRFEHLLELPDVIDNAFHIHFDTSITTLAAGAARSPAFA